MPALKRKAMLKNERIPDYLDSLCPGNSNLTEKIRSEAVEMNIPIIRRDGEQLLKVLLESKKPRKILEIGTCTGYSAIIMAENCDADITTLEIGDADYKKACENIELAGYTDRIHCIHTDATDFLNECHETYDFIFMDAAKAQYINWLPKVTEILETGGILLSDNVLHDGDIVESRFAVERRDRTTHARLREYLYELTHSEQYVTSVMNVADGVAVSVRKKA